MDRRAARSRFKAPRRRILSYLAVALVAVAGFCAVCLYVHLLPKVVEDHGNGQRSAPARANLLPDPNHLRDPCRTRRSTLQLVTANTYRKGKVLSKAFQKAVWRVTAPRRRDVERFVITSNWQGFMPDEPVPIVAGGSDLDVVLAVQCSPDRLPFVAVMSQQWNGPFALAVYIPAPAGSAPAAACRARVIQYLSHLRSRASQPIAVSLMYANGVVPNLSCDLRTGLTGFEQPYADLAAFRARFSGRPWFEIWNAEYPVNQMRSLVRSMVRRDKFLFLTEADFMVPHDMHGRLLDGAQRAFLQEMRDAWQHHRGRVAMILPAFERARTVPAAPAQARRCAHSPAASARGSACFMYGQYDVANDKDYLRGMVADGRATMFYNGTWNVGHACYDPRRWLVTDELYDFTYTNPCEPYFIALAAAMPPFEPRFKGRGRNKVTIITHMAAWGFRYTVNPDLFILHLPHAPVLTLMNMSDDAGVHINMLAAPYALSQTLLERAAGEPQFAGVAEQYLPSIGQVVVRRAAAAGAAGGGAGANISVVIEGGQDGRGRDIVVDVDEPPPERVDWLWCRARSVRGGG